MPTRRVAEVADAAVRLRHAERGEIEVRPVGFGNARIARVVDEERFAGELAARASTPSVNDGLELLMPALFELQRRRDRLAAQHAGTRPRPASR